jgi:hypothetical protein
LTAGVTVTLALIGLAARSGAERPAEFQRRVDERLGELP